MIKILVPIDFSDVSVNALRYATQAFDPNNLEITVLNIFGTESSALLMKSIDDVLIKDAETQLKAIIDTVQKDAPNVVFKTKLVKNYAVSTIASMGDSEAFNYIIMGTKGASGLKEVFMGSVAGGVIAKTSAPVIVVPADYKYNGLNTVVFSVGNDLIEDTNVLEPLRQIVNDNSSDFEVIHIGGDDTKNLENNLNTLSDLNPKFTNNTGTADLNEQLNAYIATSDADLLCLLRTKKAFFDRLFTGSVTLKQTFNSAIPLLILHE